MKRAAKIIGFICIVGFFGSIFFAVSFYYRGSLGTPRPELGRMYPINNHGFPLFLTKKEHLERTLAVVIFMVLFAAIVVLDRFYDAFDNRTREVLRKRREPWNHRWGS